MESIQDEQINEKTGRKQYLIRWMGYTARYDTWEPEENLANAHGVVQDWNQQQKMNVGSYLVDVCYILHGLCLQKERLESFTSIAQ